MSSVSGVTRTYVAPTESGTPSTAKTRGRRSRGSLRTKPLTDSAAASLVSTTVGWASVSTASSRSA
ncbi:Uncharacterised protein [Mycobacteroides abscessus subsp. massiliense]|nr:Uncharacterised protein [Mycobacteroides abscessus subsp. massiliense]